MYVHGKSDWGKDKRNPTLQKNRKRIGHCNTKAPSHIQVKCPDERQTTSPGDKHTIKQNQTRNATNKSTASPGNFKSTRFSCIQAYPNSLSHFTY